MAGQDGSIMQGVIDGVVAPEDPFVATGHLPVLPAFQTVGIGAELDGPADRAGTDRVTVLVRANR